MLLVRDAALMATGVGIGASAVVALSVFRRVPARRTSASVGCRPLNTQVLEGYSAPAWIDTKEMRVPRKRLRLANLPTPVHRWNLPRVPAGTEVWIKRDDFTGSELSGNKVRKLEFLLAEAIEQQCDSVITVGGIQSNHCRATAVAARRIGLEPHIILRTALPDTDPGFVGNLMLARMVGAKIHLVSEEEYAAKGGWALVGELRDRLISDGHKPYAFPSGGSNALGSWGYVESVAEIEKQSKEVGKCFDRIYFSCGSGGTATGLALGMLCSGMGQATELVALGVDDSPEEFHSKIDGLLSNMGAKGLTSASLLRIEDKIGRGYAQSSTAELDFFREVATATGVVLDPVYSGKAALGMVEDLQHNPASRVLFIHTGGLLGLYAKETQLAAILVGGWTTL